MTPREGERRFVESLNTDLIQTFLWPLFALFIILGVSDLLTTLIAMTFGAGFVEFNPLAAQMFRLRLDGFVLAYALKIMPAVPLFYMIVVRSHREEHDFQVRLLRFTALVILIGVDIYSGAIVLGNNLPQLLGHLVV